MPGLRRKYLGRLNADGSPDGTFSAGVDNTIFALAVQADGKILAGGYFSTLNGQARNHLGRLNNTDAARQSLCYDDSAITWQRGGSSPEVWQTSFEISDNGAWTTLGSGSRIAGGWQLGPVQFPTDSLIRARGFITCGPGLVETQLFTRWSPPRIIVDDGQFGFGANGFGFNLRGLPGQAVLVEASSDLLAWLPVQTNTLSTTAWFFRDPTPGAASRQFYRARLAQ